MAGIPDRTRNLLYRDYFQRRGGKSKRPFFVLWPVQIPCSAAPVERRNWESLTGRALWVGWAGYTKSNLESIQRLVQLSQGRFSDKELGKFLYRSITKEIGEVDLLLNGLLHFFQVTKPIKKTNTVNTLIEEVLKKNRAQLEERKAQLFKKLEENLSEIIVPVEPLKYILDFVLQYAILSSPPEGKIELLTRSFTFQKETGEPQAFFERYGGYVEISVLFSGDLKPVGQPAAALGRTPTTQKDEVLEFMLRLVKGMVLKNWGKMNLEADEKKGKRILSLRFPLERRNVIFYEPMGINPTPRLKIQKT